MPLPGHRTGRGSASILPFLVRSLASKPQERHAAADAAPRAAGAASAAAPLPDPVRPAAGTRAARDDVPR